jgi:hypothetical protein
MMRKILNAFNMNVDAISNFLLYLYFDIKSIKSNSHFKFMIILSVSHHCHMIIAKHITMQQRPPH